MFPPRIPKRSHHLFSPAYPAPGNLRSYSKPLRRKPNASCTKTFTAFIRNFLPHYGQPDADAIKGLSTAIVVDQKRIGGNSRSTLGTITDISPLLRLLFSRYGEPRVGTASNVFSFNDPAGMCPGCQGVGRKLGLDLDKFLDKSKSLNEGAILFPCLRWAPGTGRTMPSPVFLMWIKSWRTTVLKNGKSWYTHPLKNLSWKPLQARSISRTKGWP